MASSTQRTTSRPCPRCSARRPGCWRRSIPDAPSPSRSTAQGYARSTRTASPCARPDTLCASKGGIRSAATTFGAAPASARPPRRQTAVPARGASSLACRRAATPHAAHTPRPQPAHRLGVPPPQRALPPELSPARPDRGQLRHPQRGLLDPPSPPTWGRGWTGPPRSHPGRDERVLGRHRCRAPDRLNSAPQPGQP
jgi:hypothetical protein